MEKLSDQTLEPIHAPFHCNSLRVLRHGIEGKKCSILKPFTISWWVGFYGGGSLWLIAGGRRSFLTIEGKTPDGKGIQAVREYLEMAGGWYRKPPFQAAVHLGSKKPLAKPSRLEGRHPAVRKLSPLADIRHAVTGLRGDGEQRQILDCCHFGMRQRGLIFSRRELGGVGFR